MKSGTARKVQDLRPPAAVGKGEKRRAGRQKPPIGPAVPSAEQGEHQRSRGSLPELLPDLWGNLCWVTQVPTSLLYMCECNDVNKGVRCSDVISAGPGAVDVTFRDRESRICASSSETAVRTFVLSPDVSCDIKSRLLQLFFLCATAPSMHWKRRPLLQKRDSPLVTWATASTPLIPSRFGAVV